MKKNGIIPLVLAMAFSALAQQTNTTPALRQAPPPKKGQHANADRQQQEKKQRLLEKSLRKIGVGEEDRARIRALQVQHRKKMKACSERMKAARKKLARLENSDADMNQIDQAIREIADIQAEQLRILAVNRRQMKEILGEQKYALFMENARAQYHKYNHRGGDGMPPRPGYHPPSAPGQARNAPSPPLEKYIRYMDRSREQFFKKQPKKGGKAPTLQEYIRYMNRAQARYFKTHPAANPGKKPKGGRKPDNPAHPPATEPIGQP